MLQDHKFIVFALDHYNPLGVIRSLGEAGILPIYIAERHGEYFATKSKYLKECYEVEDVAEGYKILMEKYGNEKKKPFLITCDDKTTGYLDERYEELKDKFIFFNAGATGRIEEFMDKNNILECAKRHGLKVLETRVMNHGEVPEDLEYPIITKSISPNVGGWKSDVHICHSAGELKAAYEHISAPTVLIQKYIEKVNEYCLDGYCTNKGKAMFHSIASKYNYLIPGYYSPYMTVMPLEDETIRKGVEGMMEEIGFEGIYSIEFLIDKEGNYWFLEINFRNSTWSYASTCVGMSLPVLWAKSMLSGKVDESDYKEIPEGFTAMVEPIDYAKRVKTGKIDLAQWVIDFKEAGCGFYYSKDDVEPWRIVVQNWDKLG